MDVAGITEFVSKGYFRHYMLYKYVFTKKTVLDLTAVDCHTITPVPFPPLSQAKLEEEISKDAGNEV